MTGDRVAQGVLVGQPAILGGDPAFPDGLELVRPAIPDPDEVARDVAGILRSGRLTDGRFVRTLEERVADHIGVRNAVAVASCTLGLMVALRARGVTGPVVVPSFTFAATVHAVAWNGSTPLFADIDPSTLTLDPDAVRTAASTGEAPGAILATHTFGTPCDADGLGRVARELEAPLLFDAAHALGSRRGGTPIGRFGDAEVFSLSPTKVVVAGEGGLIATDDDDLADRCRLAREYGNPGDYDSRLVGLNARMSELHAAVGLRSLEGLEERVERRNALAGVYREVLSSVPGVSFPEVPEGDRSTYKDFTVLIGSDGFGADAACLARALAAEGVETRRYYAPPVHLHQAYRVPDLPSLPVTESVADRVLTLPLWTEMAEEAVERVGETVRRIQRYPGVATACRGAGRGAR